MTPTETTELLALLRAAYPATPVDADTIKIYTRSLGTIPRDAAYAGAQDHIDQSRFFPTVAELREASNRYLDLPGQYREDLPPRITKQRRSDRELARMWQEAGWYRKQDGRLYHVDDDRPSPTQPPEWALPPLPDGTRPEKPLEARIAFRLPSVNATIGPEAVRLARASSRANAKAALEFSPEEQQLINDNIVKASVEAAKAKRDGD